MHDNSTVKHQNDHQLTLKRNKNNKKRLNIVRICFLKSYKKVSSVIPGSLRTWMFWLKASVGKNDICTPFLLIHYKVRSRQLLVFYSFFIADIIQISFVTILFSELQSRDVWQVKEAIFCSNLKTHFHLFGTGNTRKKPTTHHNSMFTVLITWGVFWFCRGAVNRLCHSHIRNEMTS